MARKSLALVVLIAVCSGWLLLFSLHAVGAVPSSAIGVAPPGTFVSPSDPQTAAAAPAPQAAAAAGVQTAGVLTYAVGSDADGLDPALNWSPMSLLVGAQVCETLVNYEPGGTLPVAGLARTWSVSSDGLDWTFTLQPGVLFHDGTSLDAAAVVYNIERWWDPAHPYHQDSFFYFGYIFGGFRGEDGCSIAAVTERGTDQVRITLKAADNRLPTLLAMPFFAIASPSAIRAGTLQGAPVGSGPFRFDFWAPGELVRLTANVDYWGGRPRLDALVFQVIPDPDARLTALQSGAVQGAAELGPSQVAAAIQDRNLQVLWRAATSVGYLGINRAHPPLDNPLVCQAIAHAIHKQAIVSQDYNSTAPVAQVARQLLPPAIWSYDPGLQDYSYDPGLARSLLAQAGYTDGVTTTLWVMPVSRPYMPQPSAIAASIQADLQAVGIHVTLVNYDLRTYLAKVLGGEADLFELGWMLDYGHPYNLLGNVVCAGDASFGPRDAVLCDQVQGALREVDLQQQTAIYQAASRRVHDTLPMVPLAHVRDAVVVRSNVRGVVPAVLFAGSFKGVYFGSVQFLPVLKRGAP